MPCHQARPRAGEGFDLTRVIYDILHLPHVQYLYLFNVAHVKMAAYSYDQTKDNLRYQDGDVIIQTSPYPSGTFLVHSDVLWSASDFFQAMLKSHSWAQGRVVMDSDGEKRRIFHLHMYFDRESKMCLLTDKVRKLIYPTSTPC